MKNLALVLFACVISLFTFAGGPEKPSSTQREISRHALKREIETHFHFPTFEGNDHEVIAFAELVADTNGTVSVVQVRCADPLVVEFVKDSVKKMRLHKGESMPGESFVFKMRFRLLD